MIILTVDDEEMALRALNRSIAAAKPDAEIHGYSDTSLLLDDVDRKAFVPDVAFLDIEMPEIDGLRLSRVLKSAFPRVNIIFVTSYSQYALAAYAVRPSGYLTKPVTKDDVKNELDNLRNPLVTVEKTPHVKACCFGDFDLFVDGEPVAFLRAKSKEMLAYLIDRRGRQCPTAQIASVLWESGPYDRSRQKQIANIRADLVKSLGAVGADGILLLKGNGAAVSPDAFECDYYAALEGDEESIRQFTGEYMGQYAWAETTCGGLVRKLLG